MAIDKGLAERIREQLRHREDVVEKKMFGGLAFMVGGHMACGLTSTDLMLRVDKGDYAGILTEPYVREMDFTGRPLQGMLYIEPAGIEQDAELAKWIQRCLDFVDSLPVRI